MSKRARKVKVTTPASVTPEMLQITFNASVDASNASTQIESLEVVNEEHASAHDVLEMYRVALAQNFLERIAFEESKSAFSCADKHRNYAKDVLHARVAQVFFDARVVPDFVNRSERSGYRFNEKTTMRMRDVARFLCKVDSLTNYTDAIFRSVHAFNNAGIEFTSSHAFACCSASDRRHANVAHLMTHTREIYGETTQQAQHSMSLNALVEMHALIETRSGKRNAYRVNPDSHVAQSLIAELSLS